MGNRNIYAIVGIWFSCLIYTLYSKPIMYYVMFKVIGRGDGLTGDYLYSYVKSAITFYFYWHAVPLVIAAISTIYLMWVFLNAKSKTHSRHPE